MLQGKCLLSAFDKRIVHYAEGGLKYTPSLNYLRWFLAMVSKTVTMTWHRLRMPHPTPLGIHCRREVSFRLSRVKVTGFPGCKHNQVVFLMQEDAEYRIPRLTVYDYGHGCEKGFSPFRETLFSVAESGSMPPGVSHLPSPQQLPALSSRLFLDIGIQND